MALLRASFKLHDNAPLVTLSSRQLMAVTVGKNAPILIKKEVIKSLGKGQTGNREVLNNRKRHLGTKCIMASRRRKRGQTG